MLPGEFTLARAIKIKFNPNEYEDKKEKKIVERRKCYENLYDIVKHITEKPCKISSKITQILDSRSKTFSKPYSYWDFIQSHGPYKWFHEMNNALSTMPTDCGVVREPYLSLFDHSTGTRRRFTFEHAMQNAFPELYPSSSGAIPFGNSREVPEEQWRVRQSSKFLLDNPISIGRAAKFISQIKRLSHEDDSDPTFQHIYDTLRVTKPFTFEIDSHSGAAEQTPQSSAAEERPQSMGAKQRPQSRGAKQRHQYNKYQQRMSGPLYSISETGGGNSKSKEKSMIEVSIQINTFEIDNNTGLVKIENAIEAKLLNIKKSSLLKEKLHNRPLNISSSRRSSRRRSRRSTPSRFPSSSLSSRGSRLFSNQVLPKKKGSAGKIKKTRKKKKTKKN